MKNRYFYNISLVGVPIRIACLYPHEAFEAGQTDEAPAASAALEDGRIEKARSLYYPDLTDPDIEYTELANAVGDALLPFRRCMFHGTAFLWRGKAWIFAAPSGTGKTTQYALWKTVFGSEIRIINGDKPILEFCEGKSIMVHTSPWRGKEQMSQAISAPLGGIIYLKQAAENRMERLSVKESVLPILSQIMCTHKETETTLQACDAAEKILKAVPVWGLSNKGDADSAILAHTVILEHEEKQR